MEKAFIHQIEETIPDLNLLVECKRYKPGIGVSCKARDVGLDSYVKCLEKDSNSCPFSFSYGRSYYCTSPARIYIAKIRNMTWSHLFASEKTSLGPVARDFLSNSKQRLPGHRKRP
jgi:hypothetical protein